MFHRLFLIAFCLLMIMPEIMSDPFQPLFVFVFYGGVAVALYPGG